MAMRFEDGDGIYLFVDGSYRCKECENELNGAGVLFNVFDENSETLQIYNIAEFPTIILFSDWEIVARVEGGEDWSEVLSSIEYIYH